jgi:hypothetical protein
LSRFEAIAGFGSSTSDGGVVLALAQKVTGNRRLGAAMKVLATGLPRNLFH